MKCDVELHWGFLQYILPILEQKKSVLSYVFFGMGLP